MRKLTICFGGAMLLVSSSLLAQSGFDKGAAADKRGDYQTALEVFRPLAENGDVKAQSILGLMYSYGEGVPEDYREASRWYRRAADQGSSVAQYNLGMLYLEGKGVSQNTKEAVEWLTKAADGGHFRARSTLAKIDGGSYSYLVSEPNDSLEAPPTMAAEPEPRSVVLRKPVPPAPEPKISARAPVPPAISAASDKAGAPTNNHAPVAMTSANNAPAPAPAAPAAAPAPAPARTPAAGATGQYRVQLAASRSEENIRRDWSSYQKRYSDIFDGLDASVERAEIGDDKTVWYRLRVGPFESVASAQELCETLSARGIKTGCLPLRAGH